MEHGENSECMLGLPDMSRKVNEMDIDWTWYFNNAEYRAYIDKRTEAEALPLKVLIVLLKSPFLWIQERVVKLGGQC